MHLVGSYKAPYVGQTGLSEQSVCSTQYCTSHCLVAALLLLITVTHNSQTKINNTPSIFASYQIWARRLPRCWPSKPKS